MTVHFERGEDLTIRVNGDVLGGVTALRRTEKNDCMDIMQFLTDKPVARLDRKRWELELWIRGGGCAALDGAVESVSVSDGEKTEVYTLCRVSSLQRTAKPRETSELCAVITADERSVSA